MWRVGSRTRRRSRCTPGIPSDGHGESMGRCRVDRPAAARRFIRRAARERARSSPRWFRPRENRRAGDGGRTERAGPHDDTRAAPGAGQGTRGPDARSVDVVPLPACPPRGPWRILDLCAQCPGEGRPRWQAGSGAPAEWSCPGYGDIEVLQPMLEVLVQQCCEATFGDREQDLVDGFAEDCLLDRIHRVVAH